MIRYVQEEDILKATTEVVVSSVTTSGAMAQGLSAQVARAYPSVEKEYQQALAQDKLGIGKVWAVEPQGVPYVVVLFPTSQEASRQSDIEYIKQGMESLKEVIKAHGWKSLAMPKLGTGVGGLEWDDVKAVIVNILLSGLENVDVYIYE